MDVPLLTSGQVADAIGLSRSRFLYLVEHGDLPAPSHAVPGRRLFTNDDLENIKRVVAARQAEEEAE
jgi:DNA-binding transcriptional MerR regulator